MNANKVTVAMLKAAGFETAAGDCYSKVFGIIISLAPRLNTGTQPVGDDCVVEVTLNDGDITIEKASLLEWNDIPEWEEVEISTWIPHLPSILEKQMNRQESAINMSERELVESDAITLNFRPEVAARDNLMELGYDYSAGGGWFKSESDEWVNGRPNVGDEFVLSSDLYLTLICSYSSKWVVIGKIPMNQPSTGEMMDVVFNLYGEIKYEFSKPLTPDQLAANERLEAAYDLYCTCGIQHETVSIEEFEDEYVDVWYAVVDKTGYRK